MTVDLSKLDQARQAKHEAAVKSYCEHVSRMADGEQLTAASARKIAELTAELGITDDQLKADVGLLRSYRKTIPLAETDPLTAEEREQLAERRQTFRMWQKRRSSGWLEQQVRQAEDAYLQLADRAHGQASAQEKLNGLRRDPRLRELLSRLPDDGTTD